LGSHAVEKSWKKELETMIQGVHLRVARPTDRLDEVVRFYRDGLGLVELGSFTDHEGFDGVMLGHPGQAYHIDFTRQTGHQVGRATTQEIFWCSTFRTRNNGLGQSGR
jgi:hypothetical protein